MVGLLEPHRGVPFWSAHTVQFALNKNAIKSSLTYRLLNAFASMLFGTERLTDSILGEEEEISLRGKGGKEGSRVIVSYQTGW